MLFGGLKQAVRAEHFFLAADGFGDAVGDQHQRVARPQTRRLGLEVGVLHQADRQAAFALPGHGPALAQQQGLEVAGVDEVQAAVQVQHSKKHGCVAPHLRACGDEAVDVVEDRRRGLAQGHGGERALQHGGQQGGAQALAAHIGNHEGAALRAQLHQVEVIAAHRQAGAVDARHLEMREPLEGLGEQGLLDVAGDGQLLLHAAALAFPLD